MTNISKNQPINETHVKKNLIPLLVVLAAPFLAVLDTFIFNVAIPSIQSNFKADNANVQLIVVGYMLSYSTLLITGGRLGDIYGRKRLFLIGIVSFCLTSILGSTAWSSEELVIVRILQGAAAALMYPQSLSIIQATFNARERTKALSIFGVVIGFALIIGQVAGGVLIQLNLFELSWRPIFLINIPIGLAVIPLALRYIRESKAKPTPKLDLRGVTLLTISLLPLIFFLVMGRELSWPNWIWLLPPFAIVTGSIFLWYEKTLTKRKGAPIFQVDLLKIRSFSVGLVITAAFYIGQGSFFLLLTLFLQHGMELTPLVAGASITPLAVGFFSASLISSKLVPKLGKYLLTIGSSVAVLGVALLSFLAFDNNFSGVMPSILFSLLIIGFGYGLIIPPLIGVVLRGVPVNYAGAASGTLVTTQQIASAVGVAAIGVPFFNSLSKATSDGYCLAFGHTMYYTAGLFVATALLANFLKD
jgi:EmrB/QacA subfamily drug resistance transporter